MDGQEGLEPKEKTVLMYRVYTMKGCRHGVSEAVNDAAKYFVFDVAKKPRNAESL